MSKRGSALQALDSSIDGILLNSDGNEKDNAMRRLQSTETRYRPNSSPPRATEQRKRLFFQNSDVDFSPLKKKIDQRPVRKEVRLEKRTAGGFEVDAHSDPWDFQKIVDKEYKERLPANYEIRRWRAPSSKMIELISQLVEANMETSIEQVFQKYENEMFRVTNNELDSMEKLIKQRRGIMRDIATRIKQKLRRTKIPSRVASEDLDIEYIFAKRDFIQKKYLQELQTTERLETLLVKEQNNLEKERGTCLQLEKANKKKLTEIVQNQLHPTLTKAVNNEYGFEKKEDTQYTIFDRDIADLNLEITETIPTPNKEMNHKLYLPALERHQQVSETLHHQINKILIDGQFHEINDLVNNL